MRNLPSTPNIYLLIQFRFHFYTKKNDAKLLKIMPNEGFSIPPHSTAVFLPEGVIWDDMNSSE